MPPKPDPEILLSARELSALGSSTRVRVFDCRFSLADPEAGKRSYAEGHIAGARYADLDRDLAGPVTERSGRHPLPDRETLVERLRDWGVDNDTHVVAYDDAGGAFAARLWWLLNWLGHKRSSLLDGGLQAWAEAGLPLVQGVEMVEERGDFLVGDGSMPVVTTGEVSQRLGSDELILLDARAHARFRGEQEPLDAVAGHVPGAVCVPFSDHLDRTGRFRTPAELRALYKGMQGAGAVCMCGSGVTACHAIFAQTHAGLGTPALYVGSWSEWIRDGSRPVATGG